MLGVLGFMLGASASVVMLALGRWAIGLPFGARDFGGALAPWAEASGRLRVARAVGGVAGWYLGVALALALALMLGGMVVVDETSMRIRVSSGGPGARAGFLDGDRIVAVEGEPVGNWERLRAVIGQRERKATHITIERDGKERLVEAVPEASPGGRARILVGPYTETKSAGVLEAFAVGLAEPFKIVARTVTALVRMSMGITPTELTGTIRIAKEVSRAAGLGLAPAVKLSAGLMSYVWPLIAVASFAIALFRGRTVNGSRSGIGAA